MDSQTLHTSQPKPSPSRQKLGKVASVAIVGMEARPVEVEVHVDNKLEDFHIVGLPARAVQESRQRVKTAIRASEEKLPQKRVTINLAPGDLRKDGVLLDLPIALAILSAEGALKADDLTGHLFVGELALDGRVRGVRGVLAAAITARDMHMRLIVPLENYAEAKLVPGVEAFGVQTLTEALSFLRGIAELPAPPPQVHREAALRYPDLADVRGQALARRALEIAATGGHNVLMVGPPGSGKTMLARRFPGILPPLTEEEVMEVTHTWSVAGLLGARKPPVLRPFRAPHHHASAAAIIGGGMQVPRPGEVSLAHHGVLFLDELPLFSRSVLEALRQPLEEGVVTVARQGASVTFPARFSLVAAANPCFCGRLNEAGVGCSCSPARLDSYRSKLSGPLLDRIDIQVEVARLSESELMQVEPSEPTEVARTRVANARGLREERIAAGGKRETKVSELGRSARNLLQRALEREIASARAMSRTLRVARSIADLEGSDAIAESHVAEALQFRKVLWE